jgi:hypothetical protein
VESNRPPYVTVILAKADSDTPIPAGMIAMFDASPSGNWEVVSGSGDDLDNKFLMASDVYGITGGTYSHTHDDQVVALNTVTGTASDGKNTQSSFAGATHTHTVLVHSFDEFENLPPYINVVFAKALYYPSGIIASEVLDTTVNQSEWVQVLWNVTIESGTGISFEVRASDTPFLATDETPSWTSVGSTSPVTEDLPAGRYKQWQWRAILTPNGTSLLSPTLHDVSVDYQGD